VLNRLAAFVILSLTMDLTAAMIHGILRNKNNKANTLSAYRKINNAHISGLVDTHFSCPPDQSPMNTKIRHSYVRALPLRFHSALQKWTLVTQGKLACLHHNPKYLNYWSKALATEPLEPFPMFFLPNFQASLSAILCIKINSCIVP